jgi:hypothetical protein
MITSNLVSILFAIGSHLVDMNHNEEGATKPSITNITEY